MTMASGEITGTPRSLRGLGRTALAVIVATACFIATFAAPARSSTLFRDARGVLHLQGSDDSEYLLISQTPTGPVIAATGILGNPKFTAQSISGSNCTFLNDLDNIGDYAYLIGCPATDQQIVVDLGGGDDYLTAGRPLDPPQLGSITILSIQLTYYHNVCLDGNPFVPSAFSLRVDGGPGDDLIRGGPGPDAITGGEGNDEISPGLGQDSVAGGSGFDRATYCDRSGPVTVSLDGAANDGGPGEQDTIASDVEDLSGGSGDDRLVGDGGPNRLNGGPGNDSLAGLDGRDALAGGSGDDQLDAQDGSPELVDCGDGTDRAEVDGGDETVACEAVRRPPELLLDGEGDGSPKPDDCNDARSDGRPGRGNALGTPWTRTATASRRTIRTSRPPSTTLSRSHAPAPGG